MERRAHRILRREGGGMCEKEEGEKWDELSTTC